VCSPRQLPRWAVLCCARARAASLSSLLRGRYARRARNIEQAALAEWRLTLQSCQTSRRITERVLRRLMHSGLSSAFSSWAQRNALSRQLRRIQSVLGGMIARSNLQRALGRWVEISSANQHESRAMARAFAHRRRAVSARVLDAWCLTHAGTPPLACSIFHQPHCRPPWGQSLWRAAAQVP